MKKEIGKRIIVVGTSGSGKTTLAKQLASCLERPHIELDSLNWEANWTMAPNFVEKVDAATQPPQWVMDGNYSRARSVAWLRADTLIWLDYPFRINLSRIVWRTIKRTLLRQELWNGNRERLYTHLFTKDSLFYWIWKSHPRRKKEYGDYIANNTYPHLRWIRLQSPRQTQQWLETVCEKSNEFNR